MHSTEKNEDQSLEAIKANHRAQRAETIKRLRQTSVTALIKEITEERNAKNQAYYFILQQGHYNAFVEYCRTNKI